MVCARSVLLEALVHREVVISRAASKDLENLPASDADALLDALERLATSGAGNVRKLRGQTETYRLRFRSWRAIFKTENEGTLFVLRILHRRNAYR